MKNSYIKSSLIFLLTLLVLIISSCSKTTTNENNSEEKIDILKIECINLSAEEIQSIGILHNEKVDEIFNQINYPDCLDNNTCTDVLLETVFEDSIFLDQDFIDKDQMLVILNDLNKDESNLYDFFIQRVSHSSHNALSYIHRLSDQLELLESLEDFHFFLKTLEAEINADNSITCIESEVLNIMVSVAYHSSELWLGENSPNSIFFNNDNKINLRCPERDRCYKSDVIAADVSAAAGYFFGLAGTLAASAAAVPGANAAIAGAVAYNAASASLFAALYCAQKHQCK